MKTTLFLNVDEKVNGQEIYESENFDEVLDYAETFRQSLKNMVTFMKLELANSQNATSSHQTTQENIKNEN